MLAFRCRLSFALCCAEELDWRTQVLAQEYEKIYRTELPRSGPEQKFSIQVDARPYEKQLCPLERSCERNECTVLHHMILVHMTYTISVDMIIILVLLMTFIGRTYKHKVACM